MKLLFKIFIIGVLTLNPIYSTGFAETSGEENVDEVESILDKDSEQEEEVAAPSDKDEKAFDSIANLKNLQPFSDVAVIQRKFLPKTKRFEFFGGLNAVTNNAFFMNFGVLGRFAYHLNENLGAEFVFNWLTSSNRDVTNDLKDKRGINTDGLVAPASYYGGSVVWTPIYGKMALFENRIVPFDLYFALGGGMTNTTLKDLAPTVQLSTGQRYAISKKLAFRWDFTWNFYNTKYCAGLNPGVACTDATKNKTGNFDNLFLSVGLSFFFPEATYR